MFFCKSVKCHLAIIKNNQRQVWKYCYNKRLSYIVIQSIPFVPIIEKLKSALEIGDGQTLKDYFIKLEDTGILKLLRNTN